MAKNPPVTGWSPCDLQLHCARCRKEKSSHGGHGVHGVIDRYSAVVCSIVEKAINSQEYLLQTPWFHVHFVMFK